MSQNSDDCHVEMANELPTQHSSIEEYSSEELDDATIVRTSALAGTTMTMKKLHHSSVRETESCSSEETEIMSPFGEDEHNENDDTGSSSSSSWSTYQYIDLRYTIISNLLFLVGSSIQTYTSIVDLNSARMESALDDDGYDDDDYVLTVGDKTYYALYSLGPFMYMINAGIDFRWTLEMVSFPMSWLWSWWCCRRNGNGNENETLPARIVTHNSEHEQYQDSIEEEIEQEIEEDTEEDTDHDQDNFDDRSFSVASTVSDESSEQVWDLLVAGLFGMGALFEFYNTFLDDKYEEEQDWQDDTYLIKMENKRPWYASNYKINLVGMHLYLLSGLIELLSQRNSYRSGCNISCDIRRLFLGRAYNEDSDSSKSTSSSESSSQSSNRTAQLFMFMGTFLFVCGALFDCTIAFLNDPAILHDVDPTKSIINLNEVTLATCDSISSLLWFVDAILYIMADILLYSLHKKDSKARKWLCEKRSEEENENCEDDHGDQHPRGGSSGDEITIPLLYNDDNNRSSGSTIAHYSAL